MPTSYTGDKTQTQLPSNPPEPEGSIIGLLPADSDPPNGSTWEQVLKVLLDFIDWLMKPQAAANLFEKAIMPYRTAIGHRRFAIDHLGFPTGQVLCRDINWIGSVSSTEKLGADAGSPYQAMPEWSYKSVNATGTARAIMAPTVYGPALGLLAGEALNDYVTVSSSPLGTLLVDNHVVLEFTARVPIQSSLTTHVAICDVPGSHVAAESAFIGFRITGALSWLCVTKAASVETVTGSGVTAAIGSGRPDRLRVEWTGESVADDSIRTVRFYINGNLVATHTTNLPLGLLVGTAISQKRITAAAGGDTLVIGPMRLRMSLSELDTVY